MEAPSSDAILSSIFSAMKGLPISRVGTMPQTNLLKRKQTMAVSSSLPSIVKNEKLIANMLASNGKNEIEVAFGTFAPDGRFIPGLPSINVFINVKAALRKLTKRDPEEYDDVTETMEKEFLRKITDNKTGITVWQKKVRDKQRFIEDKDWGYRVSSSTEELLAKEVHNFIPDIRRERKRFSFVVTDTKSDFYGFRFDLTHVRQILCKDNKVTTKFEMEIERLSVKDVEHSFENFKKSIAFVLCAMQNVPTIDMLMTSQQKTESIEYHNFLFNNDRAAITEKKRSRAIEQVEKTYNEYRERLSKKMSGAASKSEEQEIETELSSAKEQKNEEIQKIKREYLNNYKLFKNYWNKPTNIRIEDLLRPGITDEYAVTIKLDGIRKFILVSENGIYACNPPSDIWKIGGKDPVEKAKEDEIPDDLYDDSPEGALDILMREMDMYRDGDISVDPKTRQITTRTMKVLPLSYYSGSLLDCEEYKDDSGQIRYYVFDVLFYKGQDTRHMSFKRRLTFAKPLVSTLKSFLWKGAIITEKMFWFKGKASPPQFVEEETSESIQKETAKVYSMDGSKITTLANYYQEAEIQSYSLYSKTREAIQWSVDNSEYNIDGLIFQPPGDYMNQFTRKWKPASSMTIDFLLRRDNQHEKDVYTLYIVGNNKDLKPFVGSKTYPLEEGGNKITYKKGTFDNVVVEGNVFECKWNLEEKVFELYRQRGDRDMPNAESTAFDVWTDINRPISQATIEGRSSEVMRRFHNNIKLEMLSKASIEEMIDIGSGRGGDLGKWNRLGIKNIFSIEPSRENALEIGNRMLEMRDFSPNVNILADINGKGELISPVSIEDHAEDDITLLGAQDTAMITEAIGKKIATIVSFFSLTFFAKNRKMWRSLVTTIDEMLLPGGLFIGIVMDGKKVKDNLDAIREIENLEEKEASAIDTETFEIVQLKSFNGALGDQIEISLNDETSMVENQKEWLFYFEDFIQELKEKGIYLLATSFIDHGPIFQLLPLSSQKFSSFNRRFIFRRFDPSKKITRKISETDSITGFPAVGKDVVRIGGERSSFFPLLHAVFRVVNSEYSKASSSQRLDMVNKAREQMASSLTYKKYLNLSRGLIASTFGASNEGFHEYISRLADPTDYIAEVYVREVVQNFVQKNVLILTPNAKLIVNEERKDDFVDYEKSVVVVALIEAGQYGAAPEYDVVAMKKGGKLVTTYSSEGPFCTKILLDAFKDM